MCPKNINKMPNFTFLAENIFFPNFFGEGGASAPCPPLLRLCRLFASLLFTTVMHFQGEGTNTTVYSGPAAFTLRVVA